MNTDTLLIHQQRPLKDGVVNIFYAYRAQNCTLTLLAVGSQTVSWAQDSSLKAICFGQYFCIDIKPTN